LLVDLTVKVQRTLLPMLFQLLHYVSVRPDRPLCLLSAARVSTAMLDARIRVVSPAAAAAAASAQGGVRSFVAVRLPLPPVPSRSSLPRESDTI
jgi:hypothetical protein